MIIYKQHQQSGTETAHGSTEAPLRTSLIILVAVSTSTTACLPQHVGRAGAAAAARKQPRYSGPEEVVLPPREALAVTATEHGGAGSLGFPAPCYWLEPDSCIRYAQFRAHCLKMRK